MIAFSAIVVAIVEQLQTSAPPVAEEIYRGARRSLSHTVQSAVGVEFIIATPDQQVLTGADDWSVQIIVECDARAREETGDAAVGKVVKAVYSKLSGGVRVGDLTLHPSLPVIESGSGVAGEKVGWAKLTYEFRCRTNSNLELAE